MKTKILPPLSLAQTGCDAPAFTRAELIIILGVLAMLAIVVLPALANNRDRSTRLLCVNNLRQMGQAVHSWGTEHGDRLPWRTPWCEGGTMPSPACSSMMQPPWLVAGLNNNVWVLWTWVSNHLASPRVLACPSDLKKTATNWGSSVNGGLWNAAYQNQAVSYLAGMDVFPEAGLGLLAGDRNVTFNATSASCSAGVAPIRTINASASGFGIGTGLHERAGNFLLTDGRVEELSSAAFVRRFREIHGWVDDVGYFHYLAP